METDFKVTVSMSLETFEAKAEAYKTAGKVIGAKQALYLAEKIATGEFPVEQVLEGHSSLLTDESRAFFQKIAGVLVRQ